MSEMTPQFKPLQSSDYPFPLVAPGGEPVMITRACGCTSMVTEDGALLIQVSWCGAHDPGYEAGDWRLCPLCRQCGSCDAGLPMNCTCGPCNCRAECDHPRCDGPEGLAMTDRCRRCSQPVMRPDDRTSNGKLSIYGQFCWPCLDRCHEASEFDHICQVCASPDEARQRGWAVVQ